MKGRLASVLFMIGAALAWAQGPPNDYFTNRIRLAGTVIEFEANMAGASWGDDACDEPCLTQVCGETIWWSWTAPASTPVIIERLGGYHYDNAGLSAFSSTNLCDLQLHRLFELDLRNHGQYAVFQAQAAVEYPIVVIGDKAASFRYRLTATNDPVFRLQPLSQTISSDSSTILSAFAVGIPPMKYQWRHNGIIIPNSTNQMISLDHATTNDAGDYCVVVTSATGVGTSQVAQVVVTVSNTPALLVAPTLASGNQFQFSVVGEIGRRYRVESSTDLKTWNSNPWEGSVVFNTNGNAEFQMVRNSPAKFLRLSQYHALNEDCINNLRQIRTAIWLCAEENHLYHNEGMGPGFNGLESYLINGVWPQCPAALGTYQTNLVNYTIVDALSTPTCQLVAEHLLEDP